MNINPYLIARLYAIQAAFAQSRFASPDTSFTNYSKVSDPSVIAKAKHWRDVLKDQEDDKGEGGGGGTMKGLRGKDAEFAKQAMRKLTKMR